MKRRVELKLNGDDISGAVRVPASEDVIAPMSTETLEELRKKHPPEHQDAHFPSKECFGPPSPPVITEELMSAVSSIPCDSAGGPDGLRPRHLKDLLVGLRDPMSLQLAQALADLVGLMLDGKVPEDVCPALYGASLIALLKKTGGIRPIAVGNTRKIVSKRVMEATDVQIAKKSHLRRARHPFRPGGSTGRPPRAIIVLSSDPEPVQVASVALQCMVS
ncbi:hypothetical protein RvY_18061-3 [Ramazzottius varieornatus]|uniref:Uncharacterized protein n=1 Tax=Ramazzottius varieornatus TaxID=947166 RepID=A0A1D1W691_RAMVA|nr:hypothetical protein RvY_18061-3 [Ramazzottius varieornatus]